jgi:glutamyl-tRNA synthetase
LADAYPMIDFLLVDDDALVIDDDALAALPEQTPQILSAARSALDGLPGGGFDAAAVEDALRARLIGGLGLKPRVAFNPIRTAIAGRKISPPLFESMAILGKARCLARLRRLAVWPPRPR